MNGSVASLFSCGYNCGTTEFYNPVTITTNMRRSAARRSENFQSPTFRSRSAERYNTNEDNPSPKVEHVLDFERASLRRATSDLFDSQQDDVHETAVADEILSAPNPNQQYYPTLLRYPVAESHNRNCWSEPPISIFTVRGSSYFKDKKKVASDPYLFQARGSDILLTDSNDNVDISKMTHLIMGGQLRKKPTLAINFSFPWGYMNLYFEVPCHLTRYMTTHDTMIESKLSPAEKTAASWLMGNQEFKNERLKLIAYVAEGPWVVRNLVTGRPALIGKKLPVTYELYPSSKHEAPLIVATLDIGNSSATAKRIVSVCRRYMSALTVDIGFVVQGETPEELPEQMLGSVRVHGPDPLKSPKLRRS